MKVPLLGSMLLLHTWYLVHLLYCNVRSIAPGRLTTTGSCLMSNLLPSCVPSAVGVTSWPRPTTVNTRTWVAQHTDLSLEFSPSSMSIAGERILYAIRYIKINLRVHIFLLKNLFSSLDNLKEYTHTHKLREKFHIKWIDFPQEHPS